MGFLIFVVIVILIAIVSLSDLGNKAKYVPSEPSGDGHVILRYGTLDAWKADLVTLWEGGPIEIEFTYETEEATTRRSVSLIRVARNSRRDLYLIGICHERKEERTFNLDRVTTKILYKSRRYIHPEFLEEVLGINADGYAFSG